MKNENLSTEKRIDAKAKNYTINTENNFKKPKEKTKIILIILLIFNIIFIFLIGFLLYYFLKIKKENSHSNKNPIKIMKS